MEKKSKVKKVIATLALLGVAAASSFLVGCDNLPGGNLPGSGGGTTIPQTQQLSIVQNIEYDENNYVFSWDEVEHADAYITSINGETSQVDTNACFYIPTEAVTEFKVKAVDTDGIYTNSDWSEVYTYNVQEQTPGDQQNIYSKVNVFVSDLLGSAYDLKDIVSLRADDNILYSSVVCEYQGNEYFYNMETEYDTEITSIQQAMELEGETYRGTRSKTISYDSAASLIKSENLPGILGEYQDSGYTITAVSSQTVEREGYEDGSIFTIYGTFKAEKNGDVKYFSCTYRCTISNPSSNPKTNYTTKLENAEDRTVKQISCTELTGDFEQFAEEKDNLTSTPTAYYGYTKSGSTSDDMSY